MGDMADYYDDRYDEYYEDNEVLLNISIRYETDKAYLIQHKNRQAWFPKSICIIEEDCIEYRSSFDPEWQYLNKKRMKPIEGDF